jgi:hypothetical protein
LSAARLCAWAGATPVFEPVPALRPSKTCFAASWAKTGAVNQSLTKAAHS